MNQTELIIWRKILRDELPEFIKGTAQRAKSLASIPSNARKNVKAA